MLASTPTALPRATGGTRAHRRRVTLRVHASSSTSSAYEQLRGVKVARASDGQEVELLSLWQASPGTRVVLPFLTHFGDLTSWELGQKLNKKALPQLQAAGVQVITVGLGSTANASRFCELVGYPMEGLYADASGAAYKALGFNPGFAAGTDVNPYLKLLPMLMGIGSPGTVQEVFRGYVGDRSAPPVFDTPTPFDILGPGYQRPFELATLRLQNMVGILPAWSSLCPPDEQLLVQQGGCLAFDGTELLFRHDDSGILGYADVDALLAAVLPAGSIGSGAGQAAASTTV